MKVEPPRLEIKAGLSWRAEVLTACKHGTDSAYMTFRHAVLVALRYALLTGILFFGLSLVMAVARPETGLFEKAALAVVVVACVALARPGQRIG